MNRILSQNYSKNFNQKATRRLSLLFLSLVVFVLSGCIPSGTDTEKNPEVVAPTSLAADISFYPKETGTTWHYLPDGYALDSIPVVRQIDGPRMAEGQLFIVDRTIGRGIDVTSYKQYNETGVYKAREVGPGYLLRLNPPIRELPAAENMQVGYAWNGSSKTEITFTDTSSLNRQQTFQTDYTYSIVDKRPVQLAGRQFQVFVINLESKLTKADGTVDNLSKEIWYTPYYGEIRNSFEQYLVGGSIFDQKR